jgi:SAM-dependent methyltransferase
MAEQGFSVTGIDFSETAIRKASTRKCVNCAFIRHDSIPPDLPASSFEVVVMLNSLHCLDRVERLEFFDQVRRVLKAHGRVFASILSLEDESYPRHEWQEINPGTFVDDTGKLFHFFSESEVAKELSWLRIQETGVLQNIHPACGRKSALFVVTAEYSGPQMGNHP